MEKKKIHTIRTVPMNAEQKRMYAEAEKEFLWSYEENDVVLYGETKWAMEKSLFLSRIAGGFTPDGNKVISTAKIEEILYLLKNDLAGQQVVVWYRFIAELTADLKYLTSKGIECAYMYGMPMKQEKVRENEAKFKAGKAQVMLAGESYACESKDFSCADTAIYRSNVASCHVRSQSEDRIVHPLKNTPLLIIDLCTEDTLDRAMTDLVKTKAFNAKLFMEKMSSKQIFQEALDLQ